ncbi:hypothetical protein ABK040_002702 [Willaertia magna]
MSDDSLSDHDEENSIEVFLSEVQDKERELKEKVFNLSRESNPTKKQRYIKEAEEIHKQAKSNISAAQDELSEYTGNDKKNLQQRLKQLENQINKHANDLKQIKENKDSGSTTTTTTSSTNNNNTGRGSVANNNKNTNNNDIEMNNTKNTTKKNKKQQQQDEDIVIQDIDDDDYGRSDNNNNGGKQEMKKGHERVDEIVDIYNQNLEILDNMIRIGDETIQIGAAAAEKLKQQTERMNLIQKDLDELGDGLKRAKKELRAFIRGTNCDKAVVCILILVVLLAVGVIIGWQVAKFVCIKGPTNTCIAGGPTNNAAKNSPKPSTSK